MKRTEITDILQSPQIGTQVLIKGWVRAFRSNRFISLNDGSCFNNLQCVVDFEKFDEELLKKISFHSCIAITGQLIESQGAGQTVEVVAEKIELLGECSPEEYPLQPKRMTLEYLREKAHFRMRTNTFSAVFRIRHAIAFAVHKYFNDKGYYYMHTPIIAGSDAEGAGEMFRVTTIDIINPPLKNTKLDEWADNFYQEIEKAINNSDQLHLRKINSFLKKTIEGLTLEKLVKARPSEIKELLDHPDISKINNLVREVYVIVRPKIFTIGNSNKTFLKDNLSQKLRQVVQLKKDYRRFGLWYQYKEKLFPSLKLTFYNIRPVNNYNQLSSESELDFSKDFFGKSTNLTVSGQLQGEIAALALGKIYTFGPTFRAENSNTPRHLAEFWMIEPEVAFFDIFDNMDLAEDFVKYLINYILDNYPDDLAFLDERIKQAEKNMKQELRRPMSLIEMLRFVIKNDFERITYTDAVRILQNSKPYKKGRFEFPVEWGKDLQAEHERYLVEKHFKKPVVVRDYPKAFKAFYMRENDDTEPGKETVAAMDILFPFIGEVIGGSQREERHSVLLERVKAQGIPEEELWWYLELRKFGGCPHSGFGLGFERMVQFITGISNIRDVIAFPRATGTAEF